MRHVLFVSVMSALLQHSPCPYTVMPFVMQHKPALARCLVTACPCSLLAHVCVKHGCSWLAQCDCWRPLRLPAILVADARLGGISTSLTAYEVLLSRGYDVPFIVMAGGKHAGVNSAAVRANVEPDTSVVALQSPLPEAPTSR